MSLASLRPAPYLLILFHLLAFVMGADSLCAVTSRWEL